MGVLLEVVEEGPCVVACAVAGPVVVPAVACVEDLASGLAASSDAAVLVDQGPLAEMASAVADAVFVVVVVAAPYD